MNEWEYSFWFKFNARKPDYTLTSEGKEKKIENRKTTLPSWFESDLLKSKTFSPMSLLESLKCCIIYLRK